jgi:hypothetical protein
MGEAEPPLRKEVLKPEKGWSKRLHPCHLLLGEILSNRFHVSTSKSSGSHTLSY